MKAFEGIVGQEHLCSYLQAALDTGRTTHAYLLVGGTGADAQAVALRFAAAIVADGDEGAFAQGLRTVHPDLHVLEPSGAGGYLVDQIRQLVHDAGLAPIRARTKAYVVNQADKLLGAPANALLKTLEEPPENVVCVLVAASEHAVLETVRSRCEVLHARELAQPQPEDPFVFQVMGTVASGATNTQLLDAAKHLVERSAEGAAGLEEDYERELQEHGEFMTQGARKALETQHKREVSAQQRAALLEQVAAARSWLRDCLLVAEGASHAVAHPQCSAQTAAVAAQAGTSGVLQALGAAKACEERISYNVTPQLAMEALLFEIKEAICR